MVCISPISAEWFRTLARYNRWANCRLYGAVEALGEAEYRCDRGAFFGSLRGTLNHILVGDRAWLARVSGEGPVPRSLDEILCDALADLAAARAAEDERIIAVMDGLDDTRLAGDLAYRSMAGDPYRQPLAWVLAHVFNHQTHHRGQAHALVSQAGGTAPPLDILYYLRELG